ncbi:hypothetical protein MMC25_002886 [Agyrium rufum]|nr:hypothetical protein [Agyrium rufum]
MGKKRKSADASNNSSKRFRSEASDEAGPNTSYTKGPLDPTYGQHGAFPGLEDYRDGGEPFYGPANDGLDYLRMVRSEAKLVPNLLVAPSHPKNTTVDNQEGERYQGYYRDGTYWSSNEIKRSVNNREEGDYEEEEFTDADELDVQEAYYHSLCDRFRNIREQLSRPPPSNIESKNLPKPFSYGTTWTQWREKLLYTQPQLHSVLCIDQGLLRKGLQVMQRLLTRNNLADHSRGRNVGSWCWALLALYKPVEQMISEEVSELRDLARVAIQVRFKWHAIVAGQMREEEYQEDEEEEEQYGEEDEEEADYDEAIPGAEDDAGKDSQRQQYLPPDPKSLAGVKDGETPNSIPAGDPPSAKYEALNPFLQIGLLNPTDQAAMDHARERLLATLETTGGLAAGPLLPPPPLQPVQLAEIESDDEGEIKDDTEDAENTVDEEVIDEVQMGTKVSKEEVERAALATLDMIITLVGECWGQKDLLDGREVWEEET